MHCTSGINSKTSALEWDSTTQDVIFLNVIIQDGSEAIHAKVTKRLSMLPGALQTMAAQRAIQMTSTSRIAQQVSPKLQARLPQKMKKKGVTVDMEEICRDGAYMVFRIRVLHVDPVILARVVTGHSGLVQWFIASLGKDWQTTIEQQYLPKQLLGTLEYEIPKILTKEMRQKKIIIETKVLTNARDQAAYYVSTVANIEKQQQDTKRIGLPKVKNLKKASSAPPEICGKGTTTQLATTAEITR